MLNILSVGLGGFVGAVCRYLIGLIPINEITTFPMKTFVINVIGCIVIGVITVALESVDEMKKAEKGFSVNFGFR